MTNKYTREVKLNKGGTALVDVYNILQAYNVTNPAIAHAIKKLLQPGQRGTKTKLQDIKEAGESIARAIQLEAPDHMNAPPEADFPPIGVEACDGEEWIKWKGDGEVPADGVRIEIKYADGAEITTSHPGDYMGWNWHELDLQDCDRVIEYRLFA